MSIQMQCSHAYTHYYKHVKLNFILSGIKVTLLEQDRPGQHQMYGTTSFWQVKAFIQYSCYRKKKITSLKKWTGCFSVSGKMKTRRRMSNLLGYLVPGTRCSTPRFVNKNIFIQRKGTCSKIKAAQGEE